MAGVGGGGRGTLTSRCLNVPVPCKGQKLDPYYHHDGEKKNKEIELWRYLIYKGCQ